MAIDGAGAIDYFLKIDGIDGESSDSKHKNELEVSSIKFVGMQSQSGGSASGGMGAGKVKLAAFEFVAALDKAGPKLFKNLCTGLPITKAILTGRKAGGTQQDYLKITLSTCLVTSFELASNSDTHSIPQSSFSLSFSKIEMEYSVQDDKGNVSVGSSGGWDVAKNQAV